MFCQEAAIAKRAILPLYLDQSEALSDEHNLLVLCAALVFRAKGIFDIFLGSHYILVALAGTVLLLVSSCSCAAPSVRTV